MLRQPSSATTTSSESHSIRGLTSAVGSASAPGLKDEQAAQDAELGGGEADAHRVPHQGDHPLDLAARARVELGDRRGLAVEHRVADLDQPRERLLAAGEELGVELGRLDLALRGALSLLVVLLGAVPGRAPPSSRVYAVAAPNPAR